MNSTDSTKTQMREPKNTNRKKPSTEMMYIKVIFGGGCFLILVFSAFFGIWDYIGNFIKEEELRFIISLFSLLLLGWGYLRFEEEWKYYK